MPKDNKVIASKTIKKQPRNIHDLFAEWHDDGVREHELDWGSFQGKELPW